MWCAYILSKLTHGVALPNTQNDASLFDPFDIRRRGQLIANRRRLASQQVLCSALLYFIWNCGMTDSRVEEIELAAAAARRRNVQHERWGPVGLLPRPASRRGSNRSSSLSLSNLIIVRHAPLLLLLLPKGRGESHLVIYIQPATHYIIPQAIAKSPLIIHRPNTKSVLRCSG